MMKFGKYFISLVLYLLSINSFAKSIIELKVIKNEKAYENTTISIKGAFLFKDSLIAKIPLKDSVYYISIDNKDVLFCRLFADGGSEHIIVKPNDTVRTTLYWTIKKVWAGSWFVRTNTGIEHEYGSINWLNDSLENMHLYQYGGVYNDISFNLRWKQRPAYTGWRYYEGGSRKEVEWAKLDSTKKEQFYQNLLSIEFLIMIR